MHGFDISSATSRVLPQSAIVERIETGFYKLRGQNHTWADIELARSRQKIFDYDPEVTYGIDGRTRYRVTINSWGLGGVLSVSTSQQQLPDLGEGWKILINGKLCGTAKRDDNLIWGLGAAFNELGVQIGDRVELEFDTWEEPVVRMMKI